MKTRTTLRSPGRLGLGALSLLLFTCAVGADDWPQWMGPQRDGVWRETGIVNKLPTNGPAVLWRTNVNRGYCGPAVTGDRLFMLDRKQGQPLRGIL